MKTTLSLVALFLTLNIYSEGPSTYYLDSSQGNDTHSGLSPDKAWKSLDRANQPVYQPGDKILLKCGCQWTGIFEPKGSGENAKPITISAYGTGEKPILDAAGAVSVGQEFSATIRLYNQEYWVIRDIHVRNFAPNEENDPLYKNGILVEGRDIGALHGFSFIHVDVTDVNGTLKDAGKLKGRENGGLKMLISRSSDKSNRIPSCFDGILVDSCSFIRTSRSGFFTVSEWKTRDLNSGFGDTTVDGKKNDWYPSHNIVVRNSRFEEVGGNGLVIRVAEGPLVEHNFFIKCSKYTTGNASYPYNCNNALWQFNEACYTAYEDGDPDASGFDSDYFCKNTIIQYNYSHDNEWGSLLVCNNGNLSRAFNDGTIVRYNVFQSDDHHTIRISGPTTNTFIYNNVFYINETQSNMDILWHKSWGGFSDLTHYCNNIIYNLGSATNYEFGGSTNNVFSNNLYYGNPVFSQPKDTTNIHADPMLVNPGSGDLGIESLDGYMLKNGSPAIDAGKDCLQGDTKDFFGNHVPSGSAQDIGIHEFQGQATTSRNEMLKTVVALSPNPATSRTILDINHAYTGNINISCLDSSGILQINETFSKNGRSISRVLNIEDLSPGTYFINVLCPGFTDTVKLLKFCN